MPVERNGAIVSFPFPAYIPNPRRLPGTEEVEDLVRRTRGLAGEVLGEKRTKLSLSSDLLPTYPQGLQPFAESLNSHGFSPGTLKPQEDGITKSPDGKLIIDWGKRAIVPPI